MLKGKPGKWYQDKHIGGYFNENGDLVVCEEYGLTDADTDAYFVEVQNGCGIMMQLENFDIMTTFIDIYDYLHILIVVRFTTGESVRGLSPFVDC